MKMEMLNKARRYADSLRETATGAERAMCKLLDDAKISYVFQSNVSCEKQRRVFIADFRIRGTYPRIFVEVDGSSHNGRESYDRQRTLWLERNRKCIVLRFKNEDVFNRPNYVLSEIKKYNPAIKTVLRSKSCRAHGALVFRRLDEGPIQDVDGGFEVTREWMLACRRNGGSWCRRQLALLGVVWPPSRGWMKSIIGRRISAELKTKFELARKS